MRRSLWTAAAATAGASLLGWATWSRYRTPHALPLRDAVAGERMTLDSTAGRVSFYCSTPLRSELAASEAAPLLLVHSVNAAGSAYEMKPLYDTLRGSRTVYVMDLPGFGFSERKALDYTPSMMSAAVVAMAAEIRKRHPVAPAPDAIALSLSCEFLARAAVDNPELFSTVGFISPTGFVRGALGGDAEDDIADHPGGMVPSAGDDARKPSGFRKVARAVDTGPWSQPLFDLLVTRPSIAFFLRRTFGSSQVDRGLVDYCYLTAHQPGARHAPLSFLAGRPFSEDPIGLFRAVRHPAWMAHGVHGAFSHFEGKDALRDRPNWTIDIFDSGAMPQFQCLAEMVRRYHAFIVHRSREPALLHGRPGTFAN